MTRNGTDVKLWDLWRELQKNGFNASIWIRCVLIVDHYIYKRSTTTIENFDTIQVQIDPQYFKVRKLGKDYVVITMEYQNDGNYYFEIDRSKISEAETMRKQELNGYPVNGTSSVIL